MGILMIKAATKIRNAIFAIRRRKSAVKFSPFRDSHHCHSQILVREKFLLGSNKNFMHKFL